MRMGSRSFLRRGRSLAQHRFCQMLHILHQYHLSYMFILAPINVNKAWSYMEAAQRDHSPRSNVLHNTWNLQTLWGFKLEVCVFNEVDREMLGKASRRVLSVKRESVELLPFNTWCSGEGKLQLSIGLSSGAPDTQGLDSRMEEKNFQELEVSWISYICIIIHVSAQVSARHYVHLISTAPSEARAGPQVPWERIYTWLWSLYYRCWEPNPGLPKELKYI